MTQNVNIYEMPAVLHIIANAEVNIKKITGCDVKLIAASNGLHDRNETKRLLKTLLMEIFGFEWHEIVSVSRKGNLPYARFFYTWVAVKNLKQSLSSTGEELGNRDHTTMINGINRIKEHIKKNDHWAVEFYSFLKKFEHIQLNVKEGNAELQN